MTALHVVTPIPVLVPGVNALGAEPPPPMAVRSSGAISEAVLEGRSYREILTLAAELEADFIVLGVQGRGAADLFLFGSTTHHVIREARCAVLTLRG